MLTRHTFFPLSRLSPFGALTALALVPFTAHTLPAQTPASPAPTPIAASASATPTSSGRPATSFVTLKADTAFTGDTPFTARGTSAGGISVAQFGAELAVPLPPLGANHFPIISLEYRHYALDRDPGTPLPDRLKSLSAAFTLFSKLDADWTLLTSVSPGFHNAGSGFTSRGFGVGALAIANRRFSPSFGAGFGLVYDSLSNGTGRVLPVATFEWKPAPAWRIFLGFPRTGAAWQARDDLSFEFTAEADFGSFYVTDDPLPAGLNKPALNRTRLEYQAVRVGPAAVWKINPASTLRVTLGAVPVLNADYDRRNFELKSDRVAPFASLALEQKF